MVLVDTEVGLNARQFLAVIVLSNRGKIIGTYIQGEL